MYVMDDELGCLVLRGAKGRNRGRLKSSRSLGFVGEVRKYGSLFNCVRLYTTFGNLLIYLNRKCHRRFLNISIQKDIDDIGNNKLIL